MAKGLELKQNKIKQDKIKQNKIKTKTNPGDSNTAWKFYAKGSESQLTVEYCYS